MTTLPSSTMNTAQARVIDPILTAVALGYTNAELIGERICPAVPVAARGGQVLQFGKEDFKKHNMRRAPGSRTARVNFGYLGAKFALVQDALEATIPREHIQEAEAVPGIDLSSMAVKRTMNIVKMGLEFDIATLVTTAANYSASNKITLSGTSQWSDYANSNPGLQMDSCKETVRQQIGRYPNLLTLGAQVFKTLKRHPKLIAQFQYVKANVLTEEMMAEYFGVDDVIVGRAVWSDDSGTMSDVWGNVAILSYSPAKPEGMMEPSFAYNYTLNGSPYVEVPYYDNSSKSWQYPTTYDRAPVMTSQEAGFLITTPV